MCVIAQGSLNNHDKVGHIKGIGLWSGRVTKTATILTLTGEGLVWSDRAGLSPNINFLREVVFTKGNFSNIGGGLMVASGGIQGSCRCKLMKL